MAPWPEQGSEPKAPDKDEKREPVDVSTKGEIDDHTDGNNTSKVEQKREDKAVKSLDEFQLKSLLDEAITYKNPKDREGKSELFKELLQEAEADESDSKGLGSSLSGKLPRAYYNLPVRRRQSRHGNQSRECGVGVSNTRGGSLQNLNALGMEGGRRSRRRDTLVSARQREGGSLPTNVNVDNDADLDMICTNYTSRATLEVSGSKEDIATSDETSASSLLKIQGHHLLPNGTDVQTKDDDHRVTETVYASSISVGPVESGAMLYPSTPVQHVSVLSIPPSQIHAGSDDHRISDNSESKKLNVTRSRQHKPMGLAHHTDESDNTSEGLLGLPLTAYWNRYSSFTLLDFQDPNTRIAFGNSADSKAKPVDENGNALACVRMDSNCIDRKKQRRVKTKNNRNVILSDEIEGFRGGADIDTLMEYIESPSLDSNKTSKARTNQANGARNSVKVRAREEEPRTIKRRKDKLQRCNSLEEISKTKMEDLTEESSCERVNGSSHPLAKKQVTLDDAEIGKKRSWEADADTTTSAHDTADQRRERTTPEPLQDLDFLVVTTKKKKKKRRTGCSGRGDPKQDYYSSRETGVGRPLRRDQAIVSRRMSESSSMPQSDRSDCSDLDSVHSLPATTTSRGQGVTGQNSVSGGSTPQASYADIARTVSSPPDGSQNNIYRSMNTSFSESSERTSTTTPNDMLPLPATFKKDAMTDTNCDKSPILTTEDYPPLIEKPDLCTESVKRSHSSIRESMPTDRVTSRIDEPVISRESGGGPRSLPTDSVCDKPSGPISKRPPVILMHEPSNSLGPEISFGFDVNYELLESEDCQCNETVAAVDPAPTVVRSSPPPAPVRDQGCYSLMQDRHLVQYLSAAWDETMEKLRTGKAKYYDGQ